MELAKTVFMGHQFRSENKVSRIRNYKTHWDQHGLWGGYR